MFIVRRILSVQPKVRKVLVAENCIFDDTSLFCCSRMASGKSTEFLRSVDVEYEEYDHNLHEGTFTNKGKFTAADESELEAFGVLKGAAGLNKKTAQNTGVLVGA